jgi:hypothetical protein
MKERPILFSAPMVRAILDGRKTQTRRIVDQRAFIETDRDAAPGRGHIEQSNDLFGAYAIELLRRPYGSVGDRLWVRETHAQFAVGEGMDRPVPQCVAYRATCDGDGGFDYVNGRGEVMRIKVTKWTPAIYMPRWASRIALEVTGVRVERLQQISEEDARLEGVGPDSTQLPPNNTHRWAFHRLWDSINAKRSPWSSNPWVWVVSFKRVVG